PGPDFGCAGGVGALGRAPQARAASTAAKAAAVPAKRASVRMVPLSLLTAPTGRRLQRAPRLLHDLEPSMALISRVLAASPAKAKVPASRSSRAARRKAPRAARQRALPTLTRLTPSAARAARLSCT